MYNPWLITIKIITHKIFQKTTLQVIKAWEVSTFLLPIGGSLVGTWMRMLFLDSQAQRSDPIIEAQTPKHKNLMPSVEAHLMPGIAHLQTTLKTKCSWLQTTFYNYGNGASQQRVDWQWCIMTTCKERKQKRTKVSGCKLWQRQFRVWNIRAMSIVHMWLFGDTLQGSKVLGGEFKSLIHQNLDVPRCRFTLLSKFNVSFF